MVQQVAEAGLAVRTCYTDDAEASPGVPVERGRNRCKGTPGVWDFQDRDACLACEPFPAYPLVCLDDEARYPGLRCRFEVIVPIHLQAGYRDEDGAWRRFA